MNVSCGTCQTVFRVDPEKVPVAGVRARCSVCSGVFWVRREVAAAPPPPIRELEPTAAPPPAAPAPPPSAALPHSRTAAPPAAAPPAATPAAAAPPHSRTAAPPGPAVSPPTAALPHSRTAAPTPPQSRIAAPAPPPQSRTAARNPFLSQDPQARARRLARALVSDIVVYHPAKRRDGLRDGSLKLLFEEEIRKSWEEFVEQVGRELAESTSFFTDALNDILADGQPVFP
jgi:predicted Zn finger-like uncharacterized protein